jgi:hypothetical protein
VTWLDLFGHYRCIVTGLERLQGLSVPLGWFGIPAVGASSLLFQLLTKVVTALARKAGRWICFSTCLARAAYSLTGLTAKRQLRIVSYITETDY